MIVIVSEKPQYSIIAGKHIAQSYPNEEIIYVHTYGINTITFKYPSKLRLSDYPRVSEPKYKVSNETFLGKDILSKSYKHIDGEMIPINHSKSELEAIFSKNPDVIILCDSDQRGVFSSDIFLSFFAPEMLNEEKKVIWADTLDEKNLAKQVAQPSSTNSHVYKSLLAEAKVKKFFEYNFNMNALVILREPFNKSFGKEVIMQISKYELQLLLFIKDTNHRITEEFLYRKMNNWKGTGKYNDQRVELGSPSSRYDIIKNLISIGAISKNDEEIFLTEKGNTFIKMLHKDTEDLDLPHRISKWQIDGIDLAFPKIERYIKTFFGKQKRFNGKTSKENTK